ncbi:PAS domain-containing protein [Pelagibius sp. Alg239-R121]|uniref:PAS domain-containing protein n=1 Tax=Pelagibius sp. Alg239-R121 TaxID=2993448 RepID=UPI0024A73D6D|nr:PAS domain-containing protein [Pelagibius sp. Alg239-R121]
MLDLVTVPDEIADEVHASLANFKAQITDDRHQALLDYWVEKRAGRAMPDRSDIDPIDIPKLLPDIGLLDVIDGGRRFYFRVVGSSINRAFGHDYTGHFLDEVAPIGYSQFITLLYRKVVQTRSPVYSLGKCRYRDASVRSIQRLLLPLTRDSDGVEQIFYSTCLGGIQGDFQCATQTVDDIITNDGLVYILSANEG